MLVSTGYYGLCLVVAACVCQIAWAWLNYFTTECTRKVLLIQRYHVKTKLCVRITAQRRSKESLKNASLAYYPRLKCFESKRKGKQTREILIITKTSYCCKNQPSYMPGSQIQWPKMSLSQLSHDELMVCGPNSFLMDIFRRFNTNQLWLGVVISTILMAIFNGLHKIVLSVSMCCRRGAA